MPEGEILSQLEPPVAVDALAVKFVALVAVTDRDCAAGVAPFRVALKVSEVGLTVSVLPPPLARLTTRVTAAVWVEPEAVIEMVP